MDITELRGHIGWLEDRNRGMTAVLTGRKLAEAQFHDHSKQTRARPDLLSPEMYRHLHGNKKYYSTTGTSRDFVRCWLADRVKGKVFLDYACGNGERTIVAAKLGAALAVGIDISPVSIENAKAAALGADVADRCLFLQGDCEHTDLPASSIDVILCNGVLHHMDLSYAYYEMRRILRDGGFVLAVEALANNPLIQLYRRMTPQMRTEWEKEHILSRKDVELAARFFEVDAVRYWHLFSILATPFRGTPAIFEPLLRLLNCVDDVALRVPGVRQMGWQFTFELSKRAGATA